MLSKIVSVVSKKFITTAHLVSDDSLPVKDYIKVSNFNAAESATVIAWHPPKCFCYLKV